MVGQTFAGCFISFWILGWSAGTLLFDARLVTGAFSQVRATNYPRVIGVVTRSEVETSSDSDGTTYTLQNAIIVQ